MIFLDSWHDFSWKKHYSSFRNGLRAPCSNAPNRHGFCYQDVPVMSPMHTCSTRAGDHSYVQRTYRQAYSYNRWKKAFLWNKKKKLSFLTLFWRKANTFSSFDKKYFFERVSHTGPYYTKKVKTRFVKKVFFTTKVFFFCIIRENLMNGNLVEW